MINIGCTILRFPEVLTPEPIPGFKDTIDPNRAIIKALIWPDKDGQTIIDELRASL